MLTSARVVATGLLVFCAVLGWPLLYASAVGHIGVAVPALLAAWSAAWFGDEMGDLIGLGSDGLVRGFGLVVLAVMGIVVAAARWHWFS